MNIAVCENGHYLGRQDLLDASEKFCPACGAPILKECPNCGVPIRKNENIVFTKYCTSCGELYPWWAEGKMKVEPLSLEEEKLLESNSRVQEALSKI